jgi:hypothetical protein
MARSWAWRAGMDHRGTSNEEAKDKKIDTILNRAERMIVYLRSYDIVITKDTKIRKKV